MVNYLIKKFQDLSHTKKTVLKNTAWLTVAEMAARFARGLLAIIAARMLGAEGLGLFSYIIALGGFLTFFEDAGIATYVTRVFAKDQNDSALRSSIFGTALVLKFTLGLLAFLMFVGFGPLISSIPQANTLIPVIALLLFSDALRGFFFSITRAQQRMHVDSWIQMVTNSLIFTFGIGFMIISPTPLSLAFGYLTGSIIGTIIVAWVVRGYIPNLITSFSRSKFKEIFYAAWPFTILAISNVLIFNTDTLFLGYYSSPTEVGFYGAASRLVMMFYILPLLFAASTFPALVQKTTDGGIRSAIKKALMLMTVLAIPLTLIMMFGSSLIVSLVFGSSFAPASLMLAILALSYLPVYVGSVLNNAVIAMDKQKQFVIANIAGVMVNIILDFILIPMYGGIGAAIASVVGLSTITIVTAIKLARFQKRSSV